MTVYSYVMLIWLPIVGRLFNRVDARILFGAGGISIVAGVALLGMWTEVWQIYISGVLWGLGGPMIFLVGPSYLINNWFAPKQAGKFLGIASAFTGVGAFVWSPTFAGLILSQGYQTALFIEAGLAAVLILIPSFFLFRNRPEDVGLQPFGIEKENTTEDKPKAEGVSDVFALKTVALYAIIVAAGLISLGGGYKSGMPTAIQSTIPNFAQLAADDPAKIAATMLGATMISAAAVGNVVGKITMGFLSDKLGIRNTMIFFGALCTVGFALTGTMLGVNQIPMLIAGFCIGTADAMMSVGLPLMTRQCFGTRDYAKIYSYINMPIAVLGGLGSVYVAFVGLNLGGFNIAYGLGIVFEVVIVAATIIAIASAKRFRDKWTVEGEPAKTSATE
jgi:MFS family permease